MKAKIITYWIVTVLLSAMMLMSAFMYLTAPKMAAAFHSLGYPDYFREMLAIAKFLGVAALLAPGLRIVKRMGVRGVCHHVHGSGGVACDVRTGARRDCAGRGVSVAGGFVLPASGGPASGGSTGVLERRYGRSASAVAQVLFGSGPISNTSSPPAVISSCLIQLRVSGWPLSVTAWT